MQPYRGIAWWAHGDDHCICANILPALLPTRIGSVDPHALKTTARRTESTLSGNAPPLRAEAGHLRLACRLVRIAARGARNGRLPNDLWWYEQAQRAFDWFIGWNDLGLDLYSSKTGGCREWRSHPA
jgi:hypothetical protein